MILEDSSGLRNQSSAGIVSVSRSAAAGLDVFAGMQGHEVKNERLARLQRDVVLLGNEPISREHKTAQYKQLSMVQRWLVLFLFVLVSQRVPMGA
jgi:hypothetical protein